MRTALQDAHNWKTERATLAASAVEFVSAPSARDGRSMRDLAQTRKAVV